MPTAEIHRSVLLKWRRESERGCGVRGGGGGGRGSVCSIIMIWFWWGYTQFILIVLDILWLSLMLLFIRFSLAFPLKFRSHKLCVVLTSAWNETCPANIAKIKPRCSLSNQNLLYTYVLYDMRVCDVCACESEDNAQPLPCQRRRDGNAIVRHQPCAVLNCAIHLNKCLRNDHFHLFASEPILIITVFPETSHSIRLHRILFWPMTTEMHLVCLMCMWSLTLTWVNRRKSNYYTQRDTATNDWLRWRKLMLICQKKYKAKPAEKTLFDESWVISRRMWNPNENSDD